MKSAIDRLKRLGIRENQIETLLQEIHGGCADFVATLNRPPRGGVIKVRGYDFHKEEFKGCLNPFRKLIQSLRNAEEYCLELNQSHQLIDQINEYLNIKSN